MDPRAGARVVDLGGPSVYQGGPEFEIKQKSPCLQKRKLVNWGRGGGGSKHVDWGARPLWPQPRWIQKILVGNAILN